jgi:gliding motility-associated-like protein
LPIFNAGSQANAIMQTVKSVFLLFILFGISSIASASDIKTPHGHTGIRFTENKNQWGSNVLYRAQLDGGLLFLEKNAFTYNFYDKETLRKNHLGKDYSSNGLIKMHAFKMSFLNALKSVGSESKQATPDYCNFFIGKDKSKWVGGVKNYKEVIYKDLYSGIDLQVLGLENNIKYNFIVSKNAKSEDIQLFYQGLDKISLSNGSLILKTSINEMVEQKPYAYQVINGNKVEVPCNFVLKKTTVSFEFPQGYNKEYEIIIDPVLIFACSSGSTADNFGMTATYDSLGNLYSGGTCFDAGFPTTLGAYDNSYNGVVLYGRTDVVITKYSSDGTSLVYSTYLGGADGTEIVTSLIVDLQDNLLLYGATGSYDFPVTQTAFDTTFNGGLYLHFISNGSFFDNGTDIFVAKFNSTGTSLIASTYIGGTMNDGVNINNDSTPVSAGSSVYEFPADSLQYNYGDQYRGEIQVDSSGNCYISSSTRSGNFPIVGGFDNTMGGKQDAVVFKLNGNFSSLIWSTYLGGTDNDAGYALILNNNREVYITGGTRSSNFPTTAGSYKPVYGGGKCDGYITHIKADGSGILHSTYIGTNNYDQTYFIQGDNEQNVYVFGQSLGAMPVINAAYSNPNAKQFVTKLDNNLSAIIFSTRVGRGGPQVDISPSAFLVDYCKNIYLSGWGGRIVGQTTTTTNMPLTSDALQSTTDGHNFYLMVLSTNASSLVYATYFGGATSWEHVDGGTSRFDKKGIIYQSVCAGCGGNDDFPVTAGAWPYTSPDYVPYVPGNSSTGINMSSNCNNGTFKFAFQVPVMDAMFTIDTAEGCDPFVVTFQNQSSPQSDYLWDFGNGDTSSVIFNPTVTYNSPGTYVIQLFVKDPTRCNVWDTVSQAVIVNPHANTNFSAASMQCSNQMNFTDLSTSGATGWQWYFGDGDSVGLQNPSHVFDSAGTYNVQLVTTTANGCKDTLAIPTLVDGLPNISISTSDTICVGSTFQLNASGGVSYSWSPTANLNNPNIANPIASPTSPTTYTVTIQTVNSINDTCVQIDSTTIYLKQDTTAFASDTLAGCAPVNIQFLNLNSPSTVYVWDFGNGDTSVVFSPNHTYPNPGVYNVQLFSKDTSSCAIWDTASLSITVNPGITADFDFITVPCSDQFTFYDSSALAPVAWAWNFDDGGSSTSQNPTHLFPAAGSYDVELISANTFGCRDTTTVQLNYNGATTTISADDTICINDPGVQLLASGGFAYSWAPGATLNSAVIANPIATPLTTTTYTVNISTINSLGDTCLQTQSTTVYVIDPSLYSLSATADDDTIPEGTSTIIHAITDTNFTVHWSPVEAVSNPFALNPTVSPEETTTYTVSILDSTGCPRTASVTVYVVSMQCKPDNVFVPNTFTPNNDGVNDVLYVRSNDLMELYFAVYNRWGQMVFETTDIKKGWDGIYKGMSADPAVFAWYLRAKCFNGDELRKKGNTTLIR